jgi:hypothetical protein
MRRSAIWRRRGEVTDPEIVGAKTPDLVQGYDLDLINLTEADLVPGYQGMALRFDADRQTMAARIHAPGDQLPANQHESFSISMRTMVAGAGQADLRLFSEAHTENGNPLFNLGTSNDGGTGHLDLFIRQTAEGLDNLGTVGHLLIDEVSIWSRGLTEDEIALLHAEGLPQAQPRRFRIEGAAARQVTTESIFEISWSSAPGAVYTVQRKNSISNAEWTDVVINLPSGGVTTTFSVDVSDQASGFYRIVQEP